MLARLAVAATIACSLAAGAPAQLASQLRRATASAELGDEGIAGISVRDALTGAVIYEWNADKPLAPASNQKLLTSAAAVTILGPSFAFNTDLIPTPDNRLVVLGSGDPAFGDREVLRELDPPLQANDAFTMLAGAAAESLAECTAVVVDDRVFDRELIHPDWPTDQLDKWYCAPVQGVNIHANVLAFYPAPSGSGATAALEPEAPWISITDRAEVITKGRNAIWIQRTRDDTAFVLRGKIQARSQAPIEISLQEPSLFAGLVIADRLRDAGVNFSQSDTQSIVSLVDRDAILDLSATPIARWSTPLDDILYRCNYDSMNLYAEALLKKIGAAVTGEQGSWANGSAVLRMLIAEILGPQAVAETTIRDGSGLSRENRVTASTLAAWLAAMYNRPEVRSMYLDTLPTAHGKLKRRFDLEHIQHDVYAKTGTINYVRCLSGYVIDPDTGRAASFSILCNGLRTGQSVKNAYRLQAEVIDTIDNNMQELSLPEAEAAPAFGG